MCAGDASQKARAKKLYARRKRMEEAGEDANRNGIILQGCGISNNFKSSLKPLHWEYHYIALIKLEIYTVIVTLIIITLIEI